MSVIEEEDPEARASIETIRKTDYSKNKILQNSNNIAIEIGLSFWGNYNFIYMY